MTPVLVVDAVTVTYGDLHALRDVSFDLEPGTVTGLIGPNGAGKTTLLDVLSGFVTPTAGSVRLDGEPLDPMPPHQRSGRGIARTFQAGELFDDMSVAENLRVATEAHGGDVARAATLVGLDPDDDRLAGELSHGERKRLGLARALAARPRVLLLDEPGAGLDADERRHLVALLRDIAADDTAVLLVDHDLAMVLDVCDRVVVLDFGAVIADADPAAVRSDPGVAAAYVGSPVAPAVAGTAPVETTVAPVTGGGPMAVVARGLWAGYGGAFVVQGVDLHVATGEVVALLGPNGAGKTTTLLALSGALPDIRGEVQVLGRPLHPGAYRQARAGVAHVLQNKRVFSGLTAAENLRLADRTGESTAEVLELLPALKPVMRKSAGQLSGGEQQMLALARALVTRPRLLVIDELSLGLAPKVVSDLLDTLRRLTRESSTAILLAEQHAELALSIASRAYVLVAGRIVLTGTAADLAAEPQRLAAAYLGAGPRPLVTATADERSWGHEGQTAGGGVDADVRRQRGPRRLRRWGR